jgi:hypothetical protein
MSKRAGSTMVEVKGSHAVYLSQPQAVAPLIEQASKGRRGSLVTNHGNQLRYCAVSAAERRQSVATAEKRGLKLWYE